MHFHTVPLYVFYYLRSYPVTIILTAKHAKNAKIPLLTPGILGNPYEMLSAIKYKHRPEGLLRAV
jgi:hypothetical protein